MRGAGRAPRGLWVHQKPLQQRDRNRTRMRCRIWPRSLKTTCRSTIKARKGGTATQARPGARQANPRGRRQGKRAKKQASRHQNRPTNIFSSSRQIWPEEQENSLQGHQYRPANRSPAADTIGTAREHSRAPVWASNTSLAATARSNTSKHQRTSKNIYFIQQRVPTKNTQQRVPTFQEKAKIPTNMSMRKQKDRRISQAWPQHKGLVTITHNKGWR